MRKYFLLLVCFVIIGLKQAKAQSINTETFLKEFDEIFEDAKKGFPYSVGDLKEKIEWFGNTYKSKKCFFNKPDYATLQYVKAHEPTKYVPEATPELYYFIQGFYGEAEKKFTTDSLEIILDAKAKQLGLNKKELKQKKENKKKYREVEYQIAGKRVFGIFYFAESKTYYIKIFSPYRPGDVAAPKNRLGCVAFAYPNFFVVYIVTVYGDKMTDMKTIVSRAYSRAGLTDGNYTYFWYEGKSFAQVEQQIGSGKTARDSGSIDL